MHSFIYLFILS